MNLFISNILIILAAICYAIISLYNFQDRPKGVKETEAFSFWGRDSWVRKYKRPKGFSPISTELIHAPDNWYYKFFKIRYREAFPGSATAFVMFTDGYHLTQWFFIKLIIIAIVIHTGLPVLNFFILWGLWCSMFTISLKHFRNERF